MLRVFPMALIAMALAVAAAAPTLAQDSTVVIGGPPTSSNVTVDMSVLDALGPEPNVPDMMMSGGARGFVPSTALGRRTLPVPPQQELQPPAPNDIVVLHPLPSSASHAARSRSTGQAHSTKSSKSAAPKVARATPAPKRVPHPPSERPPPAAPAPPPATAPAVAPPALAPPPAAPAPSATASAMLAPAPAAAPKSEREMVSPAGPIPTTRAASAPPAAAPRPPPAAAPAPAPAPSASTQTASISPTPAPPAAKPGQTSLAFPAHDAALSDAAKHELDVIAARTVKDDSLRLQLLAYASGTGEAANSARRLSLSRALAVRSYLIDKGVRSTRIDVRALGNRVEGGGNPDRVDVIANAK